MGQLNILRLPHKWPEHPSFLNHKTWEFTCWATQKGQGWISSEAKGMHRYWAKEGCTWSVPPTLVLLNIQGYKRDRSPSSAQSCRAPYTQYSWSKDLGLGSLVVSGMWDNRAGEQLWWCAASTRNPGAWQRSLQRWSDEQVSHAIHYI